jgi:hypothetical protein
MEPALEPYRPRILSTVLPGTLREEIRFKGG